MWTIIGLDALSCRFKIKNKYGTKYTPPVSQC